MRKKALFLWPQEPYLPSSLFKHYVYLGEAAAHARRFCDVSLIDLSVQRTSRSSLVKVFGELDFIFIPVEAYTARSATMLAELAQDTGTATTVAYGSSPSMNPGIFKNHFDLVIGNGHWEKSFDLLLKDPEHFYRLSKGGIFLGSNPLDEGLWPHPPLDLLPVREYLQIAPNQLEISVQKGCLFNCSFCAEKSLIPERNIYRRSPANLAEFIDANRGFDFYIDATTFTQDREWAIDVCERLKDLNWPVRWKTVTRVDKLDDELVALMAGSGCYKVGFGVETTSERLQRKIRKRIQNNTIEEGVALLNKYGIIPRAFLILGLPNQTANDVRETRRYLNDLNTEQRWKEYVPFERIPAMTNIQDFEDFERGNYRFHQINGLSQEEYISLLETER